MPEPRDAGRPRTTRAPKPVTSSNPRDQGSAADWMPPRLTLPAVKRAALACKACHLWRCGTRTVFGEGAVGARVLLVGEQPGDAEDKAGRPFVGPSGQLLDRALEEAGISRDDAYVTNAVKHFKWERGEKSARRIHKSPNNAEVRACHPWLEAELALVKPKAVVALGATAAKALLGPSFKVSTQRGRVIRNTGHADVVIATVHPSSVLRAPDREARALAEKQFMADIAVVAKALRR